MWQSHVENEHYSYLISDTFFSLLGNTSVIKQTRKLKTEN